MSDQNQASNPDPALSENVKNGSERRRVFRKLVAVGAMGAVGSLLADQGLPKVAAGTANAVLLDNGSGASVDSELIYSCHTLKMGAHLASPATKTLPRVLVYCGCGSGAYGLGIACTQLQIFNSTANCCNTVRIGSLNAAGTFTPQVTVSAIKGTFSAGGSTSSTSAANATVGGGSSNVASGCCSTVGGGSRNTSCGLQSTVSGGLLNKAGFRANVGGGACNQATGSYSTVPGGSGNIAAGVFSFAAGHHAKVLCTHTGAMLFGDGSTGTYLTSQAANEFAVRATGGVRFVTAICSSGNPTQQVSVCSAGNVGIGGTITPGSALDLNGAFSVRGLAAPNVSPASQGRVYFDSTANKFMVSENGGSYVDLVGSSLTNPMTTAGDMITGGSGGTPTRLAVGSCAQVLTVVSGAPAWQTSSGLTNPMNALGDTIYGGSGGAAMRLAGNTSTTKQFLTQTGNGSGSAAPVWATVSPGDVPTTPSGNPVGTGRMIATSSPLSGGGDLTADRTIGFSTQSTNQVLAGPSSGSAAAPTFRSLVAGDIPALDASAIATGTFPESRGGTHQSSYVAGDLLYASAANTLSRLSVGTSGQVLMVASGLPAWQNPSGGGWGLTGNAGTNPAIDFLGTSDNEDLVFKTNGIERMRLTSGGKLSFSNSGVIMGASGVTFYNPQGQAVALLDTEGNLHLKGKVIQGPTNITP